jgi:hypothetical protein
VAAKPKLGRTRAVPAIAFRVTDVERERLAALAAAAGCTVNEMARARAVGGLGEKDGVTRAPEGVAPSREVTVEYDQEVVRGR